jgi:hypothetical protein
MCFLAGEFITGTHAVLLGDVEGCPFFIDSALDAAWNTPEPVLDVDDGEPEGFSRPRQRAAFHHPAPLIARGPMTMRVAAAGSRPRVRSPWRERKLLGDSLSPLPNAGPVAEIPIQAAEHQQRRSLGRA